MQKNMHRETENNPRTLDSAHFARLQVALAHKREQKSSQSVVRAFVVKSPLADQNRDSPMFNSLFLSC